MTDELRPCPFCGAAAEKEMYPNGESQSRCSNEDCRVRPGYYDGFFSCSTDYWNTRPVEDALRGKLASVPLDALNDLVQFFDEFDPDDTGELSPHIEYAAEKVRSFCSFVREQEATE